MHPDQGFFAKLLAIAWTVFVACLLLWLAVWLIQQIWVWLLVIAVVATGVSVLVWYRRRDRL